MKHSVFLIPFIILSTCSYGQDDFVIKGTKKISKKYTPQQVMDSVNKRFPNAKAVKYYEVPPSGEKNGWAITQEDNLGSTDELSHYTVTFKSNHLSYYGFYDRDGKLLQSRIEEKLDQIPEPIRISLKYLSQEYPGYKVTSKSYYRNQNYSNVKEYYEVVATDGKSKKRLFYSEDGKLIKVKG